MGLSLYYRVVHRSSDQQAGVRAFAVLSLAGVAAVVAGGLLDPELRVWLWLAAIVLDLTAVGLVGNRRGWGVHPGHFAERHGLIVIIALGESLIVAGSALTTGASTEVLATGALAVLLTCLLWWTYFGWIRELLEEKLAELTDRDRTRLGRDAYSILHFPLEPGFNGGGFIRGAPTPRLDRLASEGLRLTNFNVEVQCSPAGTPDPYEP